MIRRRVLSLGLLACGGCSLFVEESPRFSAESDDVDGTPQTEPPRPDWLIVHTLGDPDDADVDPRGPGLLLAGSDDFVDDAYEWQAQQIDGGDIVVLQSAGEPLFNEYLFEDIGGADSVQTIIVPPGVASLEPWITWTVAHAEAVLIVGDDTYGLNWKDTPIETAIMAAWDRGAVIGGAGAGLSSLGEFVFTGYSGPLSSDQALDDPYVSNLVLDRDYLTLEPLADALIEPRFADLDRMGRLLAFAARVLEDGWSSTFVGLGVDENTALVIDADGFGDVHGEGHVYVFRTDQPPSECAPGRELEFGPLIVYRLAAGDISMWPGGETNVDGDQVFATNGRTEPGDPY
jgi:cyanophycinase-like exopeptidase